MIKPLTWPIEYGDRVFDAITIRRPPSAEVGRWFEALREADEGEAPPYLPMFVDAAGKDIPVEVLDLLDDDDRQEVFGAADRFLPKRLVVFADNMRALITRLQTPGSGEPNAPSSDV